MAALPQGEQVGQDEEHRQLGALALHIGGHPGQGVGQLLPSQSRQHPHVSAQGIAIKAGGANGLQPHEVAGLGFLDAVGQVCGPRLVFRELQQGSAVVGHLQTAPQATEDGVFQPQGLDRGLEVCLRRGEGPAGGGCPAVAGGGHWRLVR